MALTPRSAILAVGAVQGIVIAVLLLFHAKNRTANRLLAGLLLLLVFILMPYILGFAGAYRFYPWLTFAPFDLPMGFGPIIFLYVFRLIKGRLPHRWWVHLLPMTAQFLYNFILFLQPLEFKGRFNDRFHEPYVAPVESFGSLVLAVFYLIPALRLFLRYQSWLPDMVSDRENFRMSWLRNFLVSTLTSFCIWFGYEIVDEFVMPLSYVQEFPMYVWLMLLTYYLGLEGYRHAGLDYPVMEKAEPEIQEKAGMPAEEAPSSEATPLTPSGEDDAMRRFAQQVRARMEEERWYLDPALTLTDMARHLGTNTSKLSRAINTGLGENFNSFVNRYRVEAVKRCLKDPDNDQDVLSIAYDCGFNSKTNFNRGFKKVTNMTPLAYRQGSKRLSSLEKE
jgi:AraC-like DNA-binding protein